MPPPTSERPLIIERPDLQTAGQRFGYLSLTFVCWFLWLYLFVPLLSLMAWFFGARTVYEVMLQNLSLAELGEILKIYGSGVALLTVTYLIWAITSYLRFRRVDRRSPPQPATESALAASHHVPVQQLQQLKRARRAVIPVAALDVMFGTAAPAEQPAQEDGSANVQDEAA